jgi:Type II secretion system (T2SS), protein K
MKRRGLVLVLVLIVVTMLALGAYSYTEVMRTHREATELAGRQLQTRLMVDSGVDYIRTTLSLDAESLAASGGVYNNAEIFQRLQVVPDLEPRHRGCFTVVAPALDDDGNLAGVRFGLEDESTRININALLTIEKQQQGMARQLLMALPQMTEEIADSILDWIDADDETREFGAESDYYATLQPPYTPKNSPLETVEDLLRVRGVTPQLLLGSDVNRNGQIDAAESAYAAQNPLSLASAAPTTTPAGASSLLDSNTTQAANTGSMDRGWAAYLTLHSREKNLRPDGQSRIYLNQTDLAKLYEELSAVFPSDWVTFIVAYRQGTKTTVSKAERGITRPLDFSKPAKTQFTQILDLLDTQIQVTFSGDSRPTTLQSPFTSELGSLNLTLPSLLDNVTVNPADTIPGRINILQAPAPLLRGIPGMSEEIVTNILSLREAEITDEKPNRRHETWLLTEAVVTLEQMRLLQPFICSGGQVYRAQIVGYFQHGEAAARGEAIFDATGPLPRLVSWRDMSHLGRGYALETLGLDFSE